MSGTRQGGLNARDKITKHYGKDFYRNIGRAGGKVSRGGGFANDHEFASKWGKIGGATSKRGKAKK